MDYVFGVMSENDESVQCGIWSEMKYCLGAASQIMESVVAAEMSRLNFPDAIEIQDWEAGLHKITQADFDKAEKNETVMSVEVGSWHFALMPLSIYNKVNEEKNTDGKPYLEIRVGADHRNCPDKPECQKVPTKEMLEEGWLPS